MTNPAHQIADQQAHPYRWFSTYSTDWSPAVAALFAMDDSAERRLTLGHQPEPDCPGYCTCGSLCSEPEPDRRGGYWQRLDLTL